MTSKDDSLKWELMDLYMSLKNPERYEAVGKHIRDAIEEAFAGRTLEEVEAQQDALFADWYDSDLKGETGLTGREIRDMKKELRRLKSSASRPGRSIGEAALKKREIALRAFLEVDRARGKSTEAVSLAVERVGVEFKEGISEKTVRDWLAMVLPLTDIQLSGRGRPRKK